MGSWQHLFTSSTHIYCGCVLIGAQNSWMLTTLCSPFLARSCHLLLHQSSHEYSWAWWNISHILCNTYWLSPYHPHVLVSPQNQGVCLSYIHQFGSWAPPLASTYVFYKRLLIHTVVMNVENSQNNTEPTVHWYYFVCSIQRLCHFVHQSGCISVLFCSKLNFYPQTQGGAPNPSHHHPLVNLYRPEVWFTT